MNLNELKAKYAGILEKAKTENRSLSAQETTELDGLKAEITKLETEAQKGVKEAEEQRSAAAARVNGPNLQAVDKNTYFRNIAKGSADVGNKEVIADVVRQFNLTSPIYAAHQNVQRRSTGNTYSFTQITKGGAGYVKTEGNAGTSDTTSTAAMASVAFKTYSGQKVLITQEALDDYACDVAQEIMTLGMAKSVIAFGTDIVTALKVPFLVSTTFTPTETAATSWALQDIINCFYEIPIRNRYGVKFMMSSALAKTVTGLLTLDNGPQAAMIGLTKENILEIDDASLADDVLFVGNPTLALAIAMKEPVRTWVQEISEGTQFEVQPRLAVALRDAYALACRQLKAA
jgi:HK97 family phage major capsid protein